VRRHALVLALACTILSTACGEADTPAPEPAGPGIGGRIVGPQGFALDDALVIPSRDGRMLAWSSERHDADGAFFIGLEPGEPVDLQVTRRSVFEDPGDAFAHRTRMIYGMGAYTASAVGVPVGTEDAVLQLRFLHEEPVKLLISDPDGEPVADANVRLTFLADWIEVRSDARGVAYIEALPQREWQVEVTPPPEAPSLRVVTAVLPADQPILEIVLPSAD